MHTTTLPFADGRTKQYQVSNDALLPLLRSLTDDRVNVRTVLHGVDIELRRCTWGRGEKIPESVFGAPRDVGK